MNNREITSYFKDLRESRLLKKQNDINVKYAAASKYLFLSQEIENQLCQKIQPSDGSGILQWDKVTLKHMEKINKSDGLICNLPSLAKTKGTLQKV